MPNFHPVLLLGLLMTTTLSTYGQSEIIVTHKSSPVDVSQGIDLSNYTYSAINVALSQDSTISSRYSHMELTLIRNGRAVAEVRGNVEKGAKLSLSQMMSQARTGDKVMVRLKSSARAKASKMFTLVIT